MYDFYKILKRNKTKYRKWKTQECRKIQIKSFKIEYYLLIHGFKLCICILKKSYRIAHNFFKKCTSLICKVLLLYLILYVILGKKYSA